MRSTTSRLLLLLAVCFFHRGVLFSPDRHFPWDLPNWHLPQAVFQARELAAGNFPLWDPWTYAGRPFAANPQTQSFYPPRIVTVLLSGNAAPGTLLDLLDWELALHLWMGGAFAMALARRLGSGETPAFLTGSMYALSCYFASQAQHIGAVEAAAWLPACWLCALGEGRRSFVALTAALTMSMLAGFTPVTLVVYGSTLLLAALARRAPKSLAAAGTSLLAGAVLLVPAAQLSMLSVARFRTDWRGTGGGIPLAAIESLVRPWHHSIFDLTNFRLPHDVTFLYLFSGYVGLGLSLWGAVRGEGERRWPVLIVFGVSAIWMFGDSLPWGASLFALVPALLRGGFYPHHFLAVFALGIALFAGWGAERLRLGSRAAATVAAIVVIELTLAGSGRPFNHSTEAIARQVAQDCTKSVHASRLDIADYTQTPRAIQAPLTCVASANGYDPMALVRFMQVRLLMANGARWGATYPVERPRDPVLRFLGVNALVSREGELPRPALPRFFFVRRAAEAASLEEVLREIGRDDWNPREVAFIEGWKDENYSKGDVIDIRYGSNQVELRTRTQGEALLVSSEVNYPGWTASVDSVTVPVLWANASFRAVVVPAGEHTVVFRFAPELLYAAGVLSALTVLALLVSWLGAIFRSAP